MFSVLSQGVNTFYFAGPTTSVAAVQFCNVQHSHRRDVNDGPCSTKTSFMESEI